MQKRFVAILMTICLVFSAFLTGCSDNTLMIEWKKPQAGMTIASFEETYPPSMECNGTPVSYEITLWTDETGEESVYLERDTVFEPDHTYQAVLKVEVPEGKSLKTSDIVSTTKGFLPGMTWKLDKNHMEVVFRFDIAAAPAEGTILSISCDTPSVGKTPEQIEKTGPTILYNGKKQRASFSDWRIYDLNRSDEGETLSLQTPFETGHAYSVLITLDKPEGYVEKETVIRCDMETQMVENGEEKLQIRVFFDQLAYREIAPDVVIETSSLRSGMSIEEMNQTLKVTYGEKEAEAEFSWSKRVNGEVAALTEEDQLSVQNNAEYFVDIRIPVDNTVQTDELTLTVKGGGYRYHTGLMLRTLNNQRYGYVRLAYCADSLLPAQEELAQANVSVKVPSLIGEKDLSKIMDGIQVTAMNRTIDALSAQWSAYVGNGLHALNSKADLLDGLYSGEEGDQSVDYYLLTVDFPMISLSMNEVKLAVECEGQKASWISFWTDEDTSAEMASVSILIDPAQIVSSEETRTGISHGFVYVPQLYTGNTPAEVNSSILMILSGIQYSGFETQWFQGTDEEGNALLVGEEEEFRFGEEAPSLDLVLQFDSGNVNQETIRKVVIDTFGGSIGENGLEISLNEATQKVVLTLRGLQNSQAFVKVTSPTVYTGSSVSMETDSYQALWIDEYQTVELEIRKMEWRASEEIFDPDTAAAENEETVWEGETFTADKHYVNDLYMAVPENRKGTEKVSLYAGPYRALMNTDTPVSDQIFWDEGDLICAHLAVEPVYAGDCLEHTFVVNEEESKESTCSEEGLQISYCSNCGIKLEEVIPMLEHERVFNADASREATCSEAGVNVYSCSVCGARWEEELPRLAHSMQLDESRTVEATCDHEGSEISVCVNCGYQETRTLAQKEHEYEKTDQSTESTCEAMGTVVYVCKNCGNTAMSYTPALGHQYVTDPEKSTPATCTQDGTEARICSVCGKAGTTQTVLALGHDYQKDASASYPATTEAEGLNVYKCSRCSDTKSETIPRSEHVHDYQEIRIEPTCETEGSVTRICACGDEDPNVEILPALGHDFIFNSIYPASCGEEGWRLSVCSRCGKEEKEIIPAYTEHSLRLDTSKSIEATCTHEGKNVYFCMHERCDHEETETIPMLQHNYVIRSNSDGTHSHVCSSCGESRGEPENCSYSDGVCTVCGYRKPVSEDPSSEEPVG